MNTLSHRGLAVFSLTLFSLGIASAASMDSARKRWFRAIAAENAAPAVLPDRLLNGAMQAGDLIQNVRTNEPVDGGGQWSLAAHNCVVANAGAWNSLSNYRITTFDARASPSPFDQLNWSVGDTFAYSGGDPFAIAIAVQNTDWGGSMSSIPGGGAETLVSAAVTFDEGRVFVCAAGAAGTPGTQTGETQQPVAEKAKVKGWDHRPYRLDRVTKHEAGHVWGFPEAPNGFPNSIMWRDYPALPASPAAITAALTADDRDTVFFNYNTRRF